MLLSADFAFASTAGASGKDKATDVACNASGNSYVVGVYNGKVDFDPSSARTFTLPTASDDNAFVAKYSATGALHWAIGFAASGVQECQSVVVGANGNLFVTGWFAGSVDFDPSSGTTKLTSKGYEDAFLVKLTPDGKLVWAKQFGGPGHEGGLAVALDSGGSIYMQGMFDSSGDYDPGSGTATLASAGSYDVSLVKLDYTGAFAFAKRFGGSGEDFGNGLAVDASKNIISVGSFNGSVDFDPGSGTSKLTSAGKSDVFVSKLNSAGSYVWAKRLGGSGADTAGDVAVDSSGNVYSTGSFTGSADFNPSSSSIKTLTSKSGSADIFVSKLTSAGSYSWAAAIGTNGEDKGNGIAVNSTGVYVAGHFAGSADFNPSSSATYTLTSAANSQDAFAMKLTTGGSFAWARRVGGSSAIDDAESIAIRGSSVSIVGGFGSTVDFDPGSGTSSRASAGSVDAYLLGLANV